MHQSDIELKSNEKKPLVSTQSNASAWAPVLSRTNVVILASVAIVAVVVVAVVVVLTGGSDKPADDPVLSPYTLDNFLSHDLVASSPNYKWMEESENDAYSTIRRNGTEHQIVQVSVATGLGDVLCDDSALVSWSDDYWVAPGGDYILFAGNCELDSWKSLCNYVVFSVGDASRRNLTDDKVQCALWSPANGASPRIAYVVNNDVWTTLMPSDDPVRITFDGEVNEIANGVGDWLYDYRLLGRATVLGRPTMWWSPDGRRLAFTRTDESNIPSFSFPMYGRGANPAPYEMRYTVAGHRLSDVLVNVYDVDTDSVTTVDTTALAEEGVLDFYFTQVAWIAESTLALRALNRTQNLEVLLRANVGEGQAAVVFNIQTVENYINFPLSLFINGGSQLLEVRNREGYRHLALFNTDGSTLHEPERWLSGPAPYDVTGVAGYDISTGMAFFVAAVEPTERQLFRVAVDGSTVPAPLSPAGSLSSVSFSPSGQHYVHHVEGPGIPTVSLMSTQDPSATTLLEDNAHLLAAMEAYDLPTRTFEMLTGADGRQLHCWVLRPPGYSADREYPVMMYVYGGPQQTAQRVLKRFMLGGSRDWWPALASEGYIVVALDNIGTAGRGVEFNEAPFLHLGTLEVADISAAARSLGEWTDVDAARIGIYGKSFGGFITSSILAAGPGPFKAAICSAPVTDWRLYDAFFSEKYMRLPQDNEDGYERASAIARAENIGLSGAAFLLIHGTFDENVHFQNAADLALALVEAGVQFDSFYYPNVAHNLETASNGGREHYYRFLMRWIKQTV